MANSTKPFPIGDFIRERREAADLTQAGLAELSGVAASSIGELERSGRSIQLPNLEAILGALGYGWRPVLISHAAHALKSKYQPGQAYKARCGAMVSIKSFSGGRLQGTAYHGVLTGEWSPSGKKLPLCGEDPLDLIEI